MRTHTYVEHALCADGKRRYRATCPECGHVVVRSKREAALHNLSLHRTYAHDTSS